VRQDVERVSQNAVFLNIPYDESFRSLYLAYIAGLTHLGFLPRVTLGLPGGARRLDKILDLIGSCRYSIHDLSNVRLDRKSPSTPRFNMPFELGLAVAWEKPNAKRHSWFVFEAREYRIQKSLSDLNGTDPQIHDGKASGIMRGLSNIFRRPANQPTVPEMMSTFQALSRRTTDILAATGGKSLFEARAFKDLCFEAKVAADNSRLLRGLQAGT
jgi:hypothetical protein